MTATLTKTSNPDASLGKRSWILMKQFFGEQFLRKHT
jgi:hypothetical protein